MSGFPIDWPELKAARYKHDDCSCTKCGTEENLYISLQRLPDEFENTEDAWATDNLITLCEDHIVEGGKHDITKIDETFSTTTDSSSSLNVDIDETEDSLGGVATFDFDDDDSVESSDESTTEVAESEESTESRSSVSTHNTDSGASVNDNSSDEYIIPDTDSTSSTLGSTDTTTTEKQRSEEGSSRFGSFIPSIPVDGVVTTITGGLAVVLSMFSPDIETGGPKWDGVYRFGEENHYLKTMVAIGSVGLLVGLLYVSYLLYQGVQFRGLVTDFSVHYLVILSLIGFAVTYFVSMVSRVIVNSESERYRSRWVRSHLGSLYKMGMGIGIGFVSLQLILVDVTISRMFIGNIMYMVSMIAVVASLNELLTKEASKNTVIVGSWVMEYVTRVVAVCGVTQALFGSVGIVYGETAGIVVTILPVLLGVIFLLRIFSIRMNS